MTWQGEHAAMAAQVKLVSALAHGRSARWCVALWSRYIRLRDGYRCVVCHSHDRIQAHHIFRRATYPHGWYQPGNGITLCHRCHQGVHSASNGRPDLSLPLGAEGGDDQDVAAALFRHLVQDANERGLMHDQFYCIEDHMLLFFVKVQGNRHLYDFVQRNQISRLQMALEIWRNMPEAFYENLVSQLVALNWD